MLLAAARAADSDSPSGPAPRPKASSHPQSSRQAHTLAFSLAGNIFYSVCTDFIPEDCSDGANTRQAAH